MKKKIFLSMAASVLFSLIITGALVIMVSNYEYVQDVKQNLKVNNELIVNVLKNENTNDIQTFFSVSIKSNYLRETLIDKTGKVLSDTIADAETMDNHNTRIEVMNARKYGAGYSIRFSNTTKMNTLYYATSFGDGMIVRSAIPMESIGLMQWKYMMYYIAAMLISLLITLLLSSKLAKALVKPIKDMEYTTSRIAQGELHERIPVNSNDEIGELSATFNNMADRLEKSFRDSNEKQTKLEAVMQSMDSGVIAIDKENRVILINPYAEKIFGIKRDIIGEKLLNNIRDFELEDIIKNKEDNKEITIFWPVKKDLKIRTADIINGDERLGTVAVIHDITDIKKLENIRSQFVANVSHELKTPLTSIKGFAETLKDVKDNEIREKFLNIINDEAERLSRLISDILSLSKIENTKVMSKEPINVNGAISQVILLVKNAANEKNITIRTAVSSNPVIFGDEDQFIQMLINLFDNAVKYSGEGSEVVISTVIEDDSCVLTVSDNGIGIAKEHLERLFERFYRVDKARSREQGGTGLGLAIVKHIVLSFGGTIDVDSEVGRGSKFTVKIPLKNKL